MHRGHIEAISKRIESCRFILSRHKTPSSLKRSFWCADDDRYHVMLAAPLRLTGYGNVYAMMGMSAWNRKYAESGWLKGISGKFEPSLEKEVHEKPAAAGMPVLKTGLNSGADISASRIKILFSEGTARIMITADEVFADPQQFFVINYERKDKYDDGHIPGAVRYKPNATLGLTAEMSTIPAERTVVVYCGTGHNSGFVTAYLRLFGYDARTLKYGNNGFMHDKMVKDNATLSWLPFSDADINDFPVVR
jgi:rhodanese-related sulfurtransferase